MAKKGGAKRLTCAGDAFLSFREKGPAGLLSLRALTAIELEWSTCSSSSSSLAMPMTDRDLDDDSFSSESDTRSSEAATATGEEAMTGVFCRRFEADVTLTAEVSGPARLGLDVDEREEARLGSLSEATYTPRKVALGVLSVGEPVESRLTPRRRPLMGAASAIGGEAAHCRERLEMFDHCS